jgi:hypothetical protein
VDERFRESWFNSDHVVLGRRLHPFCLYDALILSEANSPFVTEDEDHAKNTFSLEDLQTAVLICSTDPEVFLASRFVRTWRDRLRLWWFGVTSRRLCRTVSHLDFQGKLFSAYLRDYNAGPELWHDEGDAPVNAIPWVLANVVHLIRTTTMTHKEVWRMPIGQAFWYSSSIAIQMGTSKSELMTAEEEAAMKELGYGEQS